MTVVNGKLTSTASKTLSGWEVRGVLYAASPVATTGIGLMLVEEGLTESTGDGTWSLDLVPNSDLVQPDGSYYSIEVREPPSDQWKRIATCSVPVSGPVNLKDILVVPSAIGSMALTHGLALAKGDILVATGPNHFIRFPASVIDGRVLTTDSTTAEGLRWGTGTGGGGGAVDSVFGRTGDVVAQTNDYAVAQINGLSAALSAKADAAATTSALATKADAAATSSALAAKADLVGGVVPSSQIPSIAITEFLGSVASQSAMLALVGQKGDWAIRTDLSTTWVITGTDPTQLASWTQIVSPAGGGGSITSVNGQTGPTVTLAAADVGAAPTTRSVSTSGLLTGGGNFTADRTITMAAIAAATVVANTTGASAAPTAVTIAAFKTALALTKADVGLGNVDNTSDANKPVSTAQAAADTLRPTVVMWNGSSYVSVAVPKIWLGGPSDPTSPGEIWLSNP